MDSHSYKFPSSLSLLVIVNFYSATSGEPPPEVFLYVDPYEAVHVDTIMFLYIVYSQTEMLAYGGICAHPREMYFRPQAFTQ